MELDGKASHKLPDDPPSQIPMLSWLLDDIGNSTDANPSTTGPALAPKKARLNNAMKTLKTKQDQLATALRNLTPKASDVTGDGKEGEGTGAGGGEEGPSEGSPDAAAAAPPEWNAEVTFLSNTLNN